MKRSSSFGQHLESDGEMETDLRSGAWRGARGKERAGEPWLGRTERGGRGSKRREQIAGAPMTISAAPGTSGPTLLFPYGSEKQKSSPRFLQCKGEYATAMRKS